MGLGREEIKGEAVCTIKKEEGKAKKKNDTKAYFIAVLFCRLERLCERTELCGGCCCKSGWRQVRQTTLCKGERVQ